MDTKTFDDMIESKEDYDELRISCAIIGFKPEKNHASSKVQ